MRVSSNAAIVLDMRCPLAAALSERLEPLCEPQG